MWVSSNVSAGAVEMGPTLHVVADEEFVQVDDETATANVLISFAGARFEPETIPQLSGSVSPLFVVRRHTAPFHTGPVPGQPVLVAVPLQIILPA